MNETIFWQFFSYFGDIAYWLGFSISFLLVYPLLTKKDKLRTRWILYDLIPTVLFTYLLVLGLKFLFKIPRPCFGLDTCPITPSFPSGHSAISFAAATIILVRLKNRVYLLFYCLATLVAISRVMLNLHKPLDVIAGAVIGIIVSLVKSLWKSNIEWFYLRKLVHFSGISILIIYYFFGKYVALATIALASASYFFSEVLRGYGIKFPIIQGISRSCIEPSKRKHIAKVKDLIGITERKFFATPLFFAIGIFILLLLFPEKAFYLGAIGVIVGDCAAGVIGKKFGKIKIFHKKEKTLEGSLACFFSTLLSYSLFTNHFSALLLAIFTTIIELIPTDYENLILPISIGILSLKIA
jgi:dolichol kinase